MVQAALREGCSVPRYCGNRAGLLHQGQKRMDFEILAEVPNEKMKNSSNQAASGNGAITSVLEFGAHIRAVPERHCSLKTAEAIIVSADNRTGFRPTGSR